MTGSFIAKGLAACGLAALLLASPAAVEAHGPEKGAATAARELKLSAVVDAPVAQAWADWTTEDGIESFFAPKAVIDLQPGGTYEIYFLPEAEPGQRGSEGTVVLGVEPEKMLTVTWAMPPYMAEVRPHLTALSIYFEPVGETRTRVSVLHTGFGQSEAWDTAHAYFDKAWTAILSQHQQKYAAGE